MSVYDDLDNIIHARYGKDVRQSIHDAISQCYSDATGNPDSVAAFAEEIIELKNRINTLESNRSWVGKIIVDSELDTMEKVIARYGGTEWVKIEGRVLVGADSTHAAGEEFGNASSTLTASNIPQHNHTYIKADAVEPHQLTAEEMPRHWHPFAGGDVGGTYTFSWGRTFNHNVFIDGGEAQAGQTEGNRLCTDQTNFNGTEAVGNDKAHEHDLSVINANTSNYGSVNPTPVDIVQPSIAVYIWKRTI